MNTSDTAPPTSNAETATSIEDFQQRLDAIRCDRHAFVWAGAGTGKTHTLTLRALYLLLMAPLREKAEGGPLIDLYLGEREVVRRQAARGVIRSLVMTTFTRKAAAEMRTRLHDLLLRLARGAIPPTAVEQRVESPDPFSNDTLLSQVVRDCLNGLSELSSQDSAGHLLQRGAEALVELSAELQIYTLHSYAATLLKRHPLHSGIPPGVGFADEDEAPRGSSADLLIDRWWRTQALADSGLWTEVEKALELMTVSQIHRWLEVLLVHPWVSEWGGEEDLRNAAADLSNWIQASRSMTRFAGRRAPYPLRKALNALDGLAQRAASGSAEDLVAFHRFLGHNPRLFLDGDPCDALFEAVEGLDPQHRPYFERRSRAERAIVDAALVGAFGQAWRAWRRVMARFRQWAVQCELRELKRVSFDDMIRLAAEMLEEHPSVREAERGRLNAILVDEFQDTDPEQLRLLSALLGRSEEERDVLGFFVGDLKQSIYRFRGTEVNLVRRFCDDYPQKVGGASQVRQFNLTTCFRSLPTVVGFVNAFFQDPVSLIQSADRLTAIRRPGTEMACSVAAESFGQAPARGGIGQLSLPFPDDEVEALNSLCQTAESLPLWIWIPVEEGEESARSSQKSRELAGHQTAYRVLALREEGLEWGEVLVLVRKDQELGPLLDSFERAGIPYTSPGMRTFYRRQEVLDVLNLLIVLHYLDDPLASAAVLASPLVGVDGATLDRLREEVSSGSVFDSKAPLPDGLPEPLDQRIESVRHLRDARLELDEVEWLRQVGEFIPWQSYAGANDREGRSWLRIRLVLDSFKRVLREASFPPLAWLLEQRRRADESDRFDADLGEDVGGREEGADAVRVLTIHKAKGLESRAVVVAGWHAVLEEMTGEFPSGHQPSALCVLARDGGRRQGFRLPWGPLFVESPDYREALLAEGELNSLEAQRLAYVAATRARDRLLLISSPSSRSQLPEHLEAFLASACNSARQVEKESGDDPLSSPRLCAETVLFRLADAYPTPRRRALLQPTIDWDSHRESWEKRQDWSKVGPLWRSPTDEEEVSTESGRGGSSQGIGRLVHRYLERHLLDAEFEDPKLAVIRDSEGMSSSACEKARDLLRRFFAEEPPAYRRRVSSSEVLGREVPFYMELEGVPWLGVIDLVFETLEGVVGVDYKTGGRREPLSQQSRKQREIYTLALRRLYPGKPVDFEFWWLGD